VSGQAPYFNTAHSMPGRCAYEAEQQRNSGMNPAAIPVPCLAGSLILRISKSSGTYILYSLLKYGQPFATNMNLMI
jgi:hypothetical protein